MFSIRSPFCHTISFAFHESTPSPSFAFPEDQVQAAADQSRGEADPSQDEGGAIGALLQADRVEAVFLIRVDGGPDHHAQGCGGKKKVRRRSIEISPVLHFPFQLFAEQFRYAGVFIHRRESARAIIHGQSHLAIVT